MPAGSRSRKPTREWFVLLEQRLKEHSLERDAQVALALEEVGIPTDPSWVYHLRRHATASPPVLWGLSQICREDLLTPYVRALGYPIKNGTPLATADFPTLEDEQGGEVLKIALSRIDPERTGEFLAEVGRLISEYSTPQPRERRGKIRSKR